MKILDFGSGNTCKNDTGLIKKMIDGLAGVDEKRECVIKWQLFEKAGKNVPMVRSAFAFAHNYAAELGFKTTASVFDEDSMQYLIDHWDVPFVKIANNPKLYPLIRLVPRKIPVFLSWSSITKLQSVLNYMNPETDKLLACVSEYPATFEKYNEDFRNHDLTNGVSDHTEDWTMYNKLEPWVYECHYKLEDSTGVDAGSFARTPKQLKEILK